MLGTFGSGIRNFGISHDTSIMTTAPLALDTAPIGSTVRITAIEGDAVAVQRVRELGIIVGALCRVIRRAPFGGAMELAVGRSRVGIRLDRSLHVSVEVL